MSKSLADLTAAIFDQLDRVTNSDQSAEQIEQEIKRSNAVVDLSDQVTRIAALQISAAKLYATHGNQVLPHLPQIGASKQKDSDA